MANLVSPKPKTSKLALVSAGCAAVLVFTIFIAYPVIYYVDKQFADWDDWGMLFFAGMANLIAVLSIVIGGITGLTGRYRIRRSGGTLKGEKIATTAVRIGGLPVIVLFIGVLLIIRLEYLGTS